MVIKTKQNRKTERLEARVPLSLKRVIERAADIQGRTITDFVIGSLERTAHDTIRSHEVLQLSIKDSIIFATALITPTKPNSALKKAFTDHWKEVRMK